MLRTLGVPLESIEQEARVLAHQRECSTTEAQQETAKRHGFNDWTELLDAAHATALLGRPLHRVAPALMEPSQSLQTAQMDFLRRLSLFNPFPCAGAELRSVQDDPAAIEAEIVRTTELIVEMTAPTVREMLSHHGETYDCTRANHAFRWCLRQGLRRLTEEILCLVEGNETVRGLDSITWMRAALLMVADPRTLSLVPPRVFEESLDENVAAYGDASASISKRAAGARGVHSA